MWCFFCKKQTVTLLPRVAVFSLCDAMIRFAEVLPDYFVPVEKTKVFGSSLAE